VVTTFNNGSPVSSTKIYEREHDEKTEILNGFNKFTVIKSKQANKTWVVYPETKLVLRITGGLTRGGHAGKVS
jgi:hypothetical protein